jgi:hypothetical protein
MLADDQWLSDLRNSVWQWLLSLSVPSHPGWIRFCSNGALLEPGEKSGLGISCLALKTCVMLGLASRLPDNDLRDWALHIKSFQTPEGRYVSFFEDPAVLAIADRNTGWFKRDVATRRAETRQACATLLSIGETPAHPISYLPKTPGEVRDYFRVLDWTQPWSAGSHAGHLLFFYGLNAKVFGESQAAEALLPVTFSEIDRLQDPETGSWYSRRPGPEQIVNGAMKILTGYAFLDKPFRYPERLIDTCLAVANDKHGCSNADVIYVLHQCARHTSHRKHEIEGYFQRRIKAIERFRRTDGAFSFFAGGAQTHYYGVPVSRGLPVSDVHGTTLFVWTLVMIGDLLGYNSGLGWQLPVT